MVKKGKQLSEGETRLLLDKYQSYLSRVGPMKTFKNKKAMWAAISEDIANDLGSHKTADQCQNRFKTIKKRRTERKQHNASSGANPTLCEMMWKIHMHREEQRERRHKEKLEVLRSLLAPEEDLEA
ncbi:uncharacterized protein LOC121837286 [Ixodes scapularis]|uniref:uncharacterized protein LOC121837286 n=1 Tax=Ixodes scapularis TaxID=6945 RepID=UPI001A9D93A3|nr:uncharacterized protein LOC121837286 [Ixodes scapularis]